MAKKKRGKATILRASLGSRIRFLFTGNFKALVKSLPKVKSKKIKLVKPVVKEIKPRKPKVVDSLSEL